jgi:predicted metal-dependent enzyme (double-stranded beta helix superfamily)
MALQEGQAESTLDRYIAEIRALWGDGKDPQLPYKVKAAMEKLFASTSPDDPWMAELMREGKPSRELYRDPEHGFIQMGHVHKQGHGNTPHDHGPCWVVYGAYSGLTEITKYQRTDDGSQAGKASLVPERLDRLAPGVVVPYLPGDIHSTKAVEGPGVVFRFLSYDLETIERNRYSLDKGTIIPVRAEQ